MLHVKNNLYDAIVVLSRGISSKGILSDSSAEHVKTAVNLYRNNAAPFIVMTGRWFYQLDFTPPITEAQAMKNLAVSLGVPESRVITEDESLSTDAQVYFTKVNILIPRVWRKILVIATEEQRPKAEFLFDKILGDDYQFTFVSSPNILSSYDAVALMYREASALFELHDWLSSVQRGDHAAMRNKLYSEHPGYNSHAPTTGKELRDRIIEGAERIKHSAMVVATDDKYVLLVKHTERSDNVTGIYGLPASEVILNETESEAASRSFRERTGLMCSDADLKRLPNVYYAVVPQKLGGRRFSGVSFVCDGFDGTLQESEKTEPLWVRISDLDRYWLMPNTRRIVEQHIALAV